MAIRKLYTGGKTEVKEDMKGIATMLRETNVPKIEGRLIRFDPETGELEGKCAMGVISCEAGLTLGSNYEDHPTWEQILIKAGVSSDILNGTIPAVAPPTIDPSGLEDYVEFLSYYIINLNDNFKLSFKEIADWIETTFPEDDWAK